ncbi:MAG: hypothetical protein ACRYGP_01030 [Janthinobacterium lividum]
MARIRCSTGFWQTWPTVAHTGARNPANTKLVAERGSRTRPAAACRHAVRRRARAREPAREDLPQRRPSAPPAPGQGPTLSSWEHELIAIACDKCGRSEAFQVAALLTAEGDVLLTNLRRKLTADCPRVVRAEVSDWCGARFESD